MCVPLRGPRSRGESLCVYLSEGPVVGVSHHEHVAGRGEELLQRPEAGVARIKRLDVLTHTHTHTHTHFNADEYM